MNDLDRIAFCRFLFIWDGDLDTKTEKDLLDKFFIFKNSDHIPHDYPMTCNKCVSDECYEYAMKLITLTDNR